MPTHRVPTCIVVPHEWALGVDRRRDLTQPDEPPTLEPWIALRPEPKRYPWTIFRIPPVQIDTAALLAEREHRDNPKPLPMPSWYYRSALDVAEPIPAKSWQIFPKPLGVYIEARGEGSPVWACRLIPLDAWRWFRREVAAAL